MRYKRKGRESSDLENLNFIKRAWTVEINLLPVICLWTQFRAILVCVCCYIQQNAQAEYRIKKVFMALMPGQSEDRGASFVRRTSGCVIHGEEVERKLVQKGSHGKTGSKREWEVIPIFQIIVTHS